MMPSWDVGVERLLRVLLVVLVAAGCFFLWRISMAAYQIERMLSANQEDIRQVASTAAAISKKIDQITERLDNLENRVRDIVPLEEAENFFEGIGDLSRDLRAEEVPRSTSAEEEIQFLISQIRASDLTFGYGEKEISSRRLSFLIRSKNRMLGKSAGSAEEFIEAVATKTVTGKEYFVLDEGVEKTPLERWLTEKLRLRREGRGE